MDNYNTDLHFQKLPMLTFDESGTIVYKNDALGKISAVKLKSKINRLLLSEALEQVKSSIESESISLIDNALINDYSSVLTVPVKHGETALIFLPPFYSQVLANAKTELLSSFVEKLLDSSVSGALGQTFVRIRKAICRNFKYLNTAYSQSLDVFELADIASSQLEVCTFPLGIKLNVRNGFQKRHFVSANLYSLANELLCLFDVCLYMSSDKTIELDVAESFESAVLKFSCRTEKTELEDSFCLEKYILSKTSGGEGHSFDISIRDGKAECSLIFPITSKLELSSADELTAAAIFREAIAS